MKMLIEVDVEILDPTWTRRNVRDCLPDYLTDIIDTAEQEGRVFRGDDGPYRVNTADLTVWSSREDYLTEMATRDAEKDAAQVAEFATRTLPGVGVKGYV